LPQRQKEKQNKKTNTAAAISQCSNNKPQKKESKIDLRASLSPSLHTNNTHVTESHRLGKIRSFTRSLTTGFVAAKQNCETPANPPQNSVPKRTQNQNRQKKWKNAQH
jgi:hypothetical protein